MLEMSGNIPIVGHGDKFIRAVDIISLIAAIIFFFPAFSSGQNYFVNTYENPSDSGLSNICIKSIDLESHSINSSLILSNRGVLKLKKPISITLNNHLYLITFSESGSGPAKNVIYEQQSKVHYSIYRVDDNDLLLVRSDSVVGAMIDELYQGPGEQGFRLGLRRFPDTTWIFPFGLYNINNNFIFRLQRRLEWDDEPGRIRGIGSFESLYKVPHDTNYRLYFTIQNSQWWLVKLDEDWTGVSDSLQLRPSGGAATLFAFHPLRNKFYSLHVNFEFHTGEVDSVYKRRQDYYINPDVWIIDPATLEITEQHPIADYPEGEYPRKENGLADVVGDFIVYYFFKEDEFYRYDPAMLFIFDTRTNEATWLRVGWR